LIEVIAIHDKITIDNASTILNDYDIIVDGSDNFATRYLVNDTCVSLDKTLIYGSILGLGQVRFFLIIERVKTCETYFLIRLTRRMCQCSMNGVLGTLPGMIGAMMAHETLKVILELPCLRNELVLFGTLNWQFTKLKF
jgi:adenylyltransferase/sulfurtransferase